MPHGRRAEQRRLRRNIQLTAVRRQHSANILDHQAVLIGILTGDEQRLAGLLIGQRIDLTLGRTGQGVGKDLPTHLA
ncbi:hypothetical protein D3C86_2002180 [compost metagenome]